MEVRTQQSGRLEDVSPLDLLQSLGIYRRPGHVVFVHPYGHSRLWFEGGEIVDAESGALRGAAALYRIATHERGEFQVEVTGEARERTIERSGSATIFEAAYRIDEGKRLRAELPATEAVLLRLPTAVPISSSGPWGSSPGGAEGRCATEEHRRVAAMLEVGATLGEVLEGSALGELETLQWLVELVKAGQIGPTGSVRSPEPPAATGLAASPGWPAGLEPSQSFVPLPSYADPGAGFDEAPAPRRRWWIPASLGAAAVVILALALVRDDAKPTDAAAVAAGSGGVLVIDATKAVPDDPDLRERPLVVGAAAEVQPVAGGEEPEPAGSPARSSVGSSSKRKAARASDRAAPESAEVEPAVQSEPKPEVGRSEDASTLLVEARRAYASGQGATAYRLASRSRQLRPSDAAAELMALAACQQGRPEAAAEALRAVPLLRRGSVRSTCKQEHGVKVKVLGGGR